MDQGMKVVPGDRTVERKQVSQKQIKLGGGAPTRSLAGELL